jgi:VWFA-related protein
LSVPERRRGRQRVALVCLALAGLTSRLPAQIPAAGEDSQAGEPPAQLVRLNIVALDEHNQPVRDLTSDDFRILDRGKRQKVTVFRRNERKTEAAGSMGAHTFSNRSMSRLPHATVILFDLLNEHMASRGYAQHEIVQAIERLESSDDLYLYILTMKGVLYPVRALPGPEGPPPGASAGWGRQVNTLLDQAMHQVFMARPMEMYWDVDFRVKATYAALADLCAALAGIPGRKSIVWLSHGVPMEIGPRRTGIDDWIDYSPYLRELSTRFDVANVAMSPVMLSPPGMSDASLAGAGNGADPTRGLESEATLQQFADLTGGHVYMEDVKTAIAQAVDEDRVGYVIEFDPYPQKWDGKYHKLRVSCTRPKVRIETKKGYYAYPPQARNADQQRLSLQAAETSPFDATEIGMRVTVSPGKAGPASRHLLMQFDSRDLLWLRDGDGSHADLDVILVEIGSEGPKSASQPVPVTLRRPASSRPEEMALNQDVPVSSGVRGMRVVVLDRDSNATGSVTFPVAMAASKPPR